MSSKLSVQSDQQHKTITLAPRDYELVQHVARQRGLGENDLHRAVQLILREWLELQEELPGAAFQGTSFVNHFDS